MAQFGSERAEHPVDVIERIACLHEWAFDRDQEDELSLSVAGGWAEYQIAFTWLPDVEALHIACSFDLRVPQRRRADVLGLVALINEQMWVGHFDIWGSHHVVMFRHALLLSDGAEPSDRQCEAVLHTAISACERYHQAFQFMLWAGKSAREALDCAMFETHGEA